MKNTDSRLLTETEMHAMQERVVQHIKNGENEPAVKLCLEMLNHDHDDPAALFQLSKVMIDQDNTGISYNLMARACKLAPDNPHMWVQFAQCHPQNPEGWRKAEWCFRKGIKISEKIGKEHPLAWSSIGVARYLMGDYSGAMEVLDKSLSIKPEHEHGLTTKSFVHLARGEWSKAWELYDVLLEHGKRESYAYGDEPLWDGTPGKRIIISAEQGIGDELMYGSCIQEVIDDSEEVVIECMPRLEKLFTRSFPGAKAVYGSRWDKTVVWGEDHKPEAHIAMASLPRHYRTTDESFPGKPYLTPDPDMVDAVRGVLDSLSNRPKIGLAWTGGSPATRGHLRERTLEELTPLLRTPGVDWISLEYYDRTEEIGQYNHTRGIPIHMYRWLTDRGLDYDLTLALISQLDLIISIPTTTVQGAGGCGVETWVIVPKYTGWMFARDVYPWAASVTPFHNPPIKTLAEKLQEWMQKRTKAVA